jgi:hypothetical protein
VRNIIGASVTDFVATSGKSQQEHQGKDKRCEIFHFALCHTYILASFAKTSFVCLFHRQLFINLPLIITQTSLAVKPRFIRKEVTKRATLLAVKIIRQGIFSHKTGVLGALPLNRLLKETRGRLQQEAPSASCAYLATQKFMMCKYQGSGTCTSAMQDPLLILLL